MIKINKEDGTQEIIIKLEHDRGDLWYATNSEGVVYQTTLDDIVTAQHCESLERERNEAREQRDRLADSLKTIEWSNNSEWQSNCAKCALATLDQQL